VEGRGWRYEVWSEPPATELGNIRFLAGFRSPRCFDDKPAMRAADRSGARIALAAGDRDLELQPE
jgi:hypothetical protein